MQIAILTSEIAELAEHLKLHHKDHSSRRGLLRKVGERRRLLKYLQRENAASHEEIIVKLKLKKTKADKKVTAESDALKAKEAANEAKK